MIQLVFAHNGTEFGAEDGMPWPHISQDFKNFKARTLGTSLIMGAKTFMSLPGKLPMRSHIVVCDTMRAPPAAKDGSLPDRVISIARFESLLLEKQDSLDKYSVIGGKAVLEQAAPFASKIIRTRINVPLEDTKPCTQHLDPVFLEMCMYFGNVVESHNWFDHQTTFSITETVSEI